MSEKLNSRIAELELAFKQLSHSNEVLAGAKQNAAERIAELEKRLSDNLCLWQESEKRFVTEREKAMSERVTHLEGLVEREDTNSWRLDFLEKENARLREALVAISTGCTGRDTDASTYADIVLETCTTRQAVDEKSGVREDNRERDGSLRDAVKQREVQSLHPGSTTVQAVGEIRYSNDIPTELKLAVGTLCRELKSDPGYRTVWQANIAMAFKDEYDRAFQKTHDVDLHVVANKAADNFLNLLCMDRVIVKATAQETTTYSKPGENCQKCFSYPCDCATDGPAFTTVEGESTDDMARGTQDVQTPYESEKVCPAHGYVRPVQGQCPICANQEDDK